MLRLLFTFTLLLLNLGWVSCLIYIKTHKADTEEKVEMKIQSDFMNIQAIQLQFHNDNFNLNFEKEDDLWKIKEPIAWEANPLALSQFLQQFILMKPQFSFKIEPSTDLSNYGLASPFCTIKCTTPEHTHILNVGNASQDNHKIYLLESETNEIFVLDDEFLKSINLPLEKWCNTALFHFSNLKSIDLETGKQKVFLKNIQGVWHMKSPLNEALDQQHAKVVCQQLMHLEFIRFLTPEEAQKAMESFVSDASLYHLTLMDESNASTLKILPINTPKNLYIAQCNDMGPLFFINSTVIERLMFAQETLRERTLFHLNFDNLNKLIYKKGHHQIVLQTVNQQHWEVVAYQNDRFIQDSKASIEAIKNLITYLNELYIEQFLDEPPELDEAVNIQFQIDGNDIHRNVNFYFCDDNCFVKMEDQAHFFQLTDASPPFSDLTAEDFQDKTIWQWGPKEQPIQIQLSSTKNEEWIDVHLTPEEQKQLAHLEAQQWLTHGIRYPLSQPIVYTLKIVTRTPESIQHTYQLQFDDRIYGTLQSGQYLSRKFTFTQPWIDFLFKITHQSTWNFWSNYIHSK